MLNLIAAVGRDNVIGNEGKLPWNLPSDMKYFRIMTEGHSVVMGRKTLESIGRSLPLRTNYVLTRKSPGEVNAKGLYWTIHDPLEVIEMAKDEQVFVIGGAEIYKEFMPVADRIYLTQIYASFEGDTFFPEIKQEEWELHWQANGLDIPHSHSFLIYNRKK